MSDIINIGGIAVSKFYLGGSSDVKIYLGTTKLYPHLQEPCFAVVDDITQYQDTEFEDVYDKATEKWYKLNNLNEYEEYGVYGSGRTITTYDGKLTIDEEITPSRLPAGYTEVEYIQNTGTSYINTDYYPNQDTRIVADMQVVTFNTYGRLLGAGNHNTANTISCDYADSSNTFEISWGGYTGWSQYTVSSSFSKYDKHTYDWNKNNFYIDGALFDTKAFKSFTCSYKLGIFNVLESNNQPTSNTGRYFYGKLYSFKIYDNDTLVRDFVPAKRDNDSKYGLYDIVNDVFYLSPNNNSFIGGSEIVLTATCEYQYSGGSWVNLGEVSGSSKTSGFTILDIEGSGTTSSFGDGDYIVISYFNHNDPKTPSSMMSYKTQSGHNYQNDFSGHTGSNTITDNTIIDAAVWKLEVTSTANTYYIKNIDTNEYFGYQNTSVNNSFYLVDSANKAPILIDDYNGGIGLIEMKQAVSSYYGGYGLNQLYGYTYRCNWLNSGSGSKANFYTNDGNALYVLYQVNSGGGLEYPVEYTVMQDPPNNLSFSSMTEAEGYECPWVGMKATIDGDNYVFSGDSQSGYEWVVYSRLPVGYTEVEYITSENVSESVLGPYIDTNYKPTQNTRIVIDFQSTSSTREFQRIFGSGEFDMLGYLVNLEGAISNRKYYYKFGQTSRWYTTNVMADLNRHTIDYNNSRQFLLDNTSIATLPNNTFTCTSNLGIFWSINTKYTTNNINLIGRVYSCQVYDNGTLIRDLVPCINPSSVVGMYDIVNDVFYSSANNYNFTAGNPV